MSRGPNPTLVTLTDDERAKLAEDPAVMPSAIEEFLRWTTPVTHILRTARRDGE